MVVDDAGKHFLAHTVFAHDEHGQIDGGYLERDFQGAVQCLAVSYNVIPLFDALDGGLFHE